MPTSFTLAANHPMPLVQRPASAPAQVQVQDLSLAAGSAAEQQFVVLYEQLYPRLCDFAERFLDSESARDAVQSAMAHVWDRWPVLSIESEERLAYCFRAVRNAIADARRFDHREAVRMGRYLRAFSRRFALEAPDLRLEREESAAIAEATLAAMPAALREAWTLVRENELTYKQAAQAAASAEITMKVRVAKAGKLLREALSAGGYGDAPAARRLTNNQEGGI